MPRWGVENTKAHWQIVALAAGLFCATTYGATTILDPGQVAREFVQRSWQKKDGLPDNHVQALLQTRDGFLWIGTSRGLARFDGSKFVVFDHLNTPAMVNDNCLSLAEDLEGNLWIGTADGLLRLRAGQFKRWTRKEGLACQDHESRDRIGPIHADWRGDVWVTTFGLDRIRNGAIQNFSIPQGFVSYGICDMLEDPAGVLWTGGVFLHRFNALTQRFEIEPESQRQEIPLFSFQPDGAGGFWGLGGFGHQARLYHFRSNNWDVAWDQFPKDFRGHFLKRDRRGDLWMSHDGGLDRFRDGQVTRFLFAPEFPNDHVLGFLEDREGNYWFGTEASGLHRWTPKAIVAQGVREGLANDSTWTIREARDGSVWIGTEAGLSQFKDGRFHNFMKLDGLAGDKIRSVAEDATGAIWVGTGSGLSVIRNGVASRQTFPHEIEKDKARAVLPGRNGALWVGTVDGLFRLQDGAWTAYRTTNGLANADVRALHEGKSGALWIGTAGGGLQNFHDGRFETWTKTNGLSNNSVWAFHEDADGVLWIGTESGLNRLESNRFTVFTTREGLPADSVNEILEDGLGHLWVSHDHGIYRVLKKELNDVAVGRARKVQAVSYDEADGLPSNETNGQKSYPAGCKTRDGRLWFPTTKGVAVINPKLCDLDAVAPQAVVEQVRADGGIIYDNSAPPTPASSEAARNNTPARTPALPGNLRGSERDAQLRLPPGSGRVLEFRYTAPVFTAPEKAAFRYRLRGVGDEWIEAGTRREAYFTRLRPGEYDFEVMAANHHGVWGEKSSIFAFSIQPFYYQTWWFYVGCCLATAGLIAGLVVWRIRELRKLHRLEQQSAITDERTRIAKDLHDGLGADLTRLALLADLADEASSATASGHRQKLSKSSREAARTLKEMIWIANPANDTVEGLVSRICQTAEDFLGDARIRCRLDIPPQLPQRTVSLDQRRNLLLVAREALNNIVKHAAATEVCIRANGSNNNFHLEIEDNGRGFDSASARPDGLGLASMRRRVENLGGTFSILSGPDGGTKILITIPLNKFP